MKGGEGDATKAGEIPIHCNPCGEPYGFNSASIDTTKEMRATRKLEKAIQLFFHHARCAAFFAARLAADCCFFRSSKNSSDILGTRKTIPPF